MQYVKHAQRFCSGSRLEEYILGIPYYQQKDIKDRRMDFWCLFLCANYLLQIKKRRAVIIRIKKS